MKAAKEGDRFITNHEAVQSVTVASSIRWIYGLNPCCVIRPGRV